MSQRRTHSRSQRFGGHTRHAHYCECGKVVYGNGGWRHFRNEDGTWRKGHRRIIERVWAERFSGNSESAAQDHAGRLSGLDYRIGDDEKPRDVYSGRELEL